MEIKIDLRIIDALDSSSILSSNYDKIIVCLAKKERSHLLLRNAEEEKTMKGMKKTIAESKRRCRRAEEFEFLKGEIEKLNDDIDKNKLVISENEKHRDPF